VPDLDGDLAWAIASWTDEIDAGAEEITLSRSNIESLTRHLTAAGFAKPKKTADFSLSDLSSFAEKVRHHAEDLLKGPRAPQPDADSVS
jgi:hypothetical protein